MTLRHELIKTASSSADKIKIPLLTLQPMAVIKKSPNIDQYIGQPLKCGNNSLPWYTHQEMSWISTQLCLKIKKSPLKTNKTFWVTRVSEAITRAASWAARNPVLRSADGMRMTWNQHRAAMTRLCESFCLLYCRPSTGMWSDSSGFVPNTHRSEHTQRL